MNKNRLIKIILKKCEDGKGLNKRQGEIVNCFIGLANINLQKPFNTEYSSEPNFKKLLNKEIKEFIKNNDSKQIEDVFEGVEI